MTASERRKAPRHNLVQYLQVFDQETEDLVGRVVDVSKKGMMLVGERPYDTDAGTLRLRMVLPPTLDSASHVDFEAECRWNGPDVNSELYDGGFEFVNPTDDLKDTLDLVVDQLSFDRGIEEDTSEAR